MPENEENIIYQVDKVKFIVSPVYKPSGEPIWTILEKLILTEMDPHTQP